MCIFYTASHMSGHRSNKIGATYHWHAAALNILYVGSKEWRMTPPIYRGLTGMSARQAAKRLDEHHTIQCVSCRKMCICVMN